MARATSRSEFDLHALVHALHSNLPDLESSGRYDRDFLAVPDSKKLPLFQRWNFQKKVELPKMHIFVEHLWKLFGSYLEVICTGVGNTSARKLNEFALAGKPSKTSRRHARRPTPPAPRSAQR
jgi:hypothetical protein